ncbi:MAG TPA: hypothetical protein PLO93_05035 [Candidatus Omnitrophota bacterium]|nr:hypothetical protein [Candidatus Omnitrophota bacterium]HQL41641.1 hypothetical protein [Candidatus Omnitrophota bacterium]
MSGKVFFAELGNNVDKDGFGVSIAMPEVPDKRAGAWKTFFFGIKDGCVIPCCVSSAVKKDPKNLIGGLRNIFLEDMRTVVKLRKKI